MTNKISQQDALGLVKKLADSFNRISGDDFTTVAHPETTLYATALSSVLNDLAKPASLQKDVDTAGELLRKLSSIGSSDFQAFHAPDAQKFGQALTNIAYQF